MKLYPNGGGVYISLRYGLMIADGNVVKGDCFEGKYKII